MSPRVIVAALISLLVLGVLPKRAHAALVDTQIGVFTDGGTFEYMLGLATAGKGSRTAAIIIAGPDRTKNEYKPRSAFFSNKAQWDEFVALWTKARATSPPKRTGINGASVDIGQYFDKDDLTLVTVAVNDDATIQINLMGKDKWPMLFGLRPKDFEEFDSVVNKISAYFGK